MGEKRVKPVWNITHKDLVVPRDLDIILKYYHAKSVELGSPPLKKPLSGKIFFTYVNVLPSGEVSLSEVDKRYSWRGTQFTRHSIGLMFAYHLYLNRLEDPTFCAVMFHTGFTCFSFMDVKSGMAPLNLNAPQKCVPVTKVKKYIPQ